MTAPATCGKTGKIVYTRKAAMKTAAAFRRRGARMSHYSCKSCAGWHVGNNRAKPVQRGRRR